MDHYSDGDSRVLRRVLLSAGLLTFGNAALAAAVVPHRAVYDLKLLRSSQGAAIGAVSGLMAYEVSGSECDGWTVNFRLVNQFDYKEGNSRLIDSQSSSWETGDGLTMNYSQKEFVDSKQESEKRLSVTRAEKDGPGEGVINLPAVKNFTIAPETIFPMRHQLRLMEAAEKGEVRDTSLVYDGSDEDKTVRAISSIGKKVNAGESKEDVANQAAAALQAMPSWPVSIGYYSTDDANVETPIYEISFDMYQNGVSTGLVMDYGEFALEGKLKNLEMFKVETCQ